MTENYNTEIQTAINELAEFILGTGLDKPSTYISYSEPSAQKISFSIEPHKAWLTPDPPPPSPSPMPYEGSFKKGMEKLAYYLERAGIEDLYIRSLTIDPETFAKMNLPESWKTVHGAYDWAVITAQAPLDENMLNALNKNHKKAVSDRHEIQAAHFPDATTSPDIEQAPVRPEKPDQKRTIHSTTALKFLCSEP